MAKTPPVDPRHPTEVFGEKIESLERSAIRSWSSVLAAVGAFALLAGIVLIVMAYQMRTYKAPSGIGNVAQIQIAEPRGATDHLPASFQWDEVSGAHSYFVTVQRAEDDSVLLLRASPTTRLATTAEDLGLFGPGGYRWTVEARSASGKILAWGEAEFTVEMSRP